MFFRWFDFSIRRTTLIGGLTVACTGGNGFLRPFRGKPVRKKSEQNVALFLRGLEKKYARSRSSSRDTPFHDQLQHFPLCNESVPPRLSRSFLPRRFPIQNFAPRPTLSPSPLSSGERDETKRMAERSRNDLHCYFLLGEINSPRKTE